MKNNEIIVLIPTLNPNEKLITLVNELKKNGFNYILIVDDGSTDKSIIKKIKVSKIIEHAENKGKGAALKTGFEYLQEINFKGVITIDDDLQHDIQDIKKVCNSFLRDNHICFGTRVFDNAPMIRKFSNKLTSYLFEKKYKYDCKDTQTGLRIFPKNILNNLLQIKGNRFEYEMNVLKYLALNKIEINQIPIKTIYFKGQKSSHFKAIKDSILIYQILFRSDDYD